MQTKNQYDGSFSYKGRKIYYKIVDNEKPIKNEKLSRYINFYENGNSLGVRSIYGSYDEMTNISDFDAAKWFEEYIEMRLI